MRSLSRSASPDVRSYDSLARRSLVRAACRNALIGVVFATIALTSGANRSSAQDVCEPAEASLSDAEGRPGSIVSIDLIGRVACPITGFSIAIGHNAELLRFVSGAPSPLLTDHARSDLVFNVFDHQADGFVAVFAAFDLSFPIDVPPIPIPAPETLATIRYLVSPDAPVGTVITLRNENRTFGAPNPVANVFTVASGGTEVFPRLSNGTVRVVGRGFLRGDANDDEVVDVADAVFSLQSLFQGGGPPRCEDAADANDDGALDVSDPIITLIHLFSGRLALPAPGPSELGQDPTGDSLGCDTAN